MNASLELLASMLPEGADAALIASQTNRRYFTGFSSDLGYLLQTRKKSYLLVDSRYSEAAQAEARGVQVITFKKLSESLHALVEKHSLGCIALEGSGFNLNEARSMETMLSPAELIETAAVDEAIGKLRIVKTSYEVEKIMKAQRITEQALTETLPLVKPGVMERDIALELEYLMRKKGADGVYGPSNPLGRNIKFGVREHAMAAITNGITLHGGLRGYCSGFFVFSDYLKPAVRLAALMHLPSLFFFSHDSVCVGEDGPTHQPIEQLTMFRSTPNVNTVRPADAKEMTSALIQAFGKNTYPTVITSSRQAVLNLEETSAEEAKKGAYIVYTPSKPAKNVIISCGTELAACIDAAKALEEKKIYATVVSIPSQFLFDQQSEEYKETILPKNLRKVAVEMGATMSWYKYADIVKGIDTFGASMPIDEIYATYGFRVEDLVEYFKGVLK